LTDNYDELNASLFEQVQPEDLVIGGTAVRETLGIEDEGYWPNDREPEAHITLERWAKMGHFVVRIAKQCPVDKRDAGLLLRQVRQPLPRLPFVAGIRTLNAAHRTAPWPLLDVSLFNSSDQPVDDVFKQMRTTANRFLMRNESTDPATRLDRDQLNLIDKDRNITQGIAAARSIYGWRYGIVNLLDTDSIEDLTTASFEFQNSLQPPTDHLVDATQSIIENHLDKMQRSLSLTTIASTTIRNGKRIRPSQPQHG
jgi:hypothetical protein